MTLESIEDDGENTEADNTLLHELLKRPQAIPELYTVSSSGFYPAGWPHLTYEHEVKLGQLGDQIRTLEAQIAQARNDSVAKATEVERLKAAGAESAAQNAELKSTLEEYHSKQRLSHLISRVCEPAQSTLLGSSGATLLQAFEKDSPCEAFVMSIDIRRSTELMLKARTPKLFADFVTSLCASLREVILQSFGVFDKFTGDGILAFFPKFYSGDDAGYRVIQAAAACHRRFEEHYKRSRRCFTSVLNDTGLGIGIDFGLVQIVKLGGECTVVGTPVVYACRMGAADPGVTLLNQPAFEAIFEPFSGYASFDETEISFKHEGSMVAYSVSLNGKEYSPASPSWLKAASSPSTKKQAAKP